jgi:tRNA threonylcarbamoyladenosine biosynthesis protein TsaE
VDLYRLDTARQVATLGLDEILDREAIVLVEWGERFPDLFPAARIEIHLQALSETMRQVTIIQ